MKTQTVIIIPSELAESSEKLHELGGPREDYTVADAVRDTVMAYDHVIWPFGEISGRDFERLLCNVYAPSVSLDYACAACAWIEKIERTGFGVKCSPVFAQWKMELLKVSDYGTSWRAAK